MHTCRRKAGFPPIFESMYAKREGAVKLYLCFKIKFGNLRRRLFHINLHAYMST